MSTTKMQFATVEEFKTRYGISKIEIVESPQTKKWFAATMAGNFKAQVGIDLSKPVRFIYESEDLYSEGCFTNVDNTANVRGVL